MSSWFKWWWAKPKEEILFPEILMQVAKNPKTGTDDVYITMDWPKNMSRDRIFEVYSKLLYLTQSGNLYDVFQKSFSYNCSATGHVDLAGEVDAAVKKYSTDASKNLVPDDTDLCVYPSQVFQVTHE